ncbi:uncharacterized protein BT62DRAFT_1074923, partial [Guyanagaster necrorhizus]
RHSPWKLSSWTELLPSNEFGPVIAEQRFFSTSIVGIKALRHRHWVTSRLQLRRRNTTTAERLLTLLVESGIIYCLSGITVLIATVIRLPFGTPGDVYTPVNV